MARKRVAVPKIETVDAFLSHSPDPTAGHAQKAHIDEIHLSQQQPRRYFDPEKLDQLTASIRQHGILEPLLVRPLDSGGYELIAGERRLRAAKQAGLSEVPIVSRTLTDQQALQVALMENLQREDLNPLEETEAVLDLLMLDLDLPKQEVISLLHRAELAQRRDQALTYNDIRQIEKVSLLFEELGRFTLNSFRANRLPLLNLPQDVLDVLQQGKLEYTKAQVIARVKDEKQRRSLLKQTVDKPVSLAQLREKLRALAPEPTNEPTLSARLKVASHRLKGKNYLDDPKQQRKLEKLLQDLEKLLEEVF